MIELFRLKVFRTVAEQRNFRRAAEHLYLSQPAVTQQIKGLEGAIGAPLFDRTGKEVALTQSGKILLRYAKQVETLLARASEEIAASLGHASGELAIGVSTTIAQYVIPAILGEFVRMHPGVTVKLASVNTEAVVEALITKQVTIGLVEGPTHRRELAREPWLMDELVLMVPSSHEWAGQKEVSLEQLANAPFLMREHGSGTRDIIELGLKKAGISPKDLRCAMELNSTEAILSCIEAGLGVGFVSRTAVKRQLKLGTLKMVPVRKLDLYRQFTIQFLRDSEPSSVAGMFLEHLRRYSASRQKRSPKSLG